MLEYEVQVLLVLQEGLMPSVTYLKHTVDFDYVRI
jgi:hypothetical protein